MKDAQHTTHMHEHEKCKLLKLKTVTIEAPDSITDRARGLVETKEGIPQCANFFFHLNKKFGKMIKKRRQYMLNVIPHIFSSINFCVRTIVFFIIIENRVSLKMGHSFANRTDFKKKNCLHF